ncbi:twin-arginine translocase subunit TatC [Thermincola ferriacetica]
MDEKRMPILKHLEELRRVLIISFLSIIPTSVVCWFYRKELMHLLTRPVDRLHYKLVYIGPTEAFIANIKIAVIGGIILASPVIMWQVWSFILPALTRNEKRAVIIIMPISILLFVTGVVFGYLTVFNFGIEFLLGFGGDGLEPMLSLSKYLSFAFWFLLPFGLIFEMPLVILFLTRLGLVTPQFLAKNRRFALLIIFIISAVVTPTTDMVSQFAMAGPMYVLYEISIWISRFMKAKKRKEEETEKVEGVEEAEEVEEAEKTWETPGVSGDISDSSAVQKGGEQEDTTANNVKETSADDEVTIPFIDEDPKEKRLKDIYKNITEKGNGPE